MPSYRRRRGRSPALSFILCAVLIAALVLAVYLLAGPGRTGPDQAAATPLPPTPGVEPTAAPTASPVPVVLAETADMGQEYIDKMVFIGNSITYRMATEYTIPFTQVWVCPMGTISLGNFFLNDINYYPPEDPDNPVELSLAECAARRKPEYAVITLGTHDASTMPEEQFKNLYTQIIQTIREASPDTKVICQSIFPVNEAAISASEKIYNPDIVTANGWIRDIAAQQGVRYLNTYEALVDAAGGMIADYAPWDGIHLSTAGFDAVFRYIRTHAWQ